MVHDIVSFILSNMSTEKKILRYEHDELNPNLFTNLLQPKKLGIAVLGIMSNHPHWSLRFLGKLCSTL